VKLLREPLVWYTPEARLVKKQDFYPGLKPWLP